VDVLSSRILLRLGDLDRSRRFYRDTLGLAITPAAAQDSAGPRSMVAYAAQAEPLSAG
jgi:catechol 2,3-dioxygenase-like lactoylglutathione lyase family enzyme